MVEKFVVYSYDKTIKVWDFETGEMKLDFRKGQKSIVFDVSIDFGKVVSVGHDSNITIVCPCSFCGLLLPPPPPFFFLLQL